MKPLALPNRTYEVALYDEEVQVIVDLGLLPYILKESRLAVWLVHIDVVSDFAAKMLFYYQAQNDIDAESNAMYWQTVLTATQCRELLPT